MSTLIYCPTDHAILLLACHTNDSLLRFPIESGELPGLSLRIPGLTPINQLLLDRARTVLPAEVMPHLNIYQDFSERVEFNDQSKATVFLASLIHETWQPPETWPTLPLLIRSMGKNSNRIAYMKALQYLASSKDEVKAIAPEHLLH